MRQQGLLPQPNRQGLLPQPNRQGLLPQPDPGRGCCRNGTEAGAAAGTGPGQQGAGDGIEQKEEREGSV